MTDQVMDQTMPSKSGPECGTVRELIPGFVGGALSPADRMVVQRHVAACADCRSELDLVQLLYSSRGSAPAGLLARVERAAAADRMVPRRTHTWWGVSAAAIAALALGIGITSNRAPTSTTEVPAYVYEAAEGEIWMSDDGLVAGAPSFDDLSDEALLEFLDDLTVGTGGGAA